MSRLPEHVLQGSSAQDRDLALDWWEALDPEPRAELARMWDRRAEDTALTRDEEERVWRSLPIQLVGMFVDEENRADERLAKQELLEYINNHEEISAYFYFGAKSYHICRAHPKAREALGTGFLPASFVCPLREGACPMRRILEICPGRSVALSIGLGSGLRP
jgi:hypothetical protein